MSDEAVAALIAQIAERRGDVMTDVLKTDSNAKALADAATAKRRGRPRVSTFLDNGNLEPWILSFASIAGLEDGSTAEDVAKWMDSDLRSKGKNYSQGNFFFEDDDGYSHEVRITVKSMTIAAEATRAKAIKSVVEASPEQADAVNTERRNGVVKAAGVLDDDLKDAFVAEFDTQVQEQRAAAAQAAAAATTPPPPVA
jgi:hypothetical protein